VRRRALTLVAVALLAGGCGTTVSTTATALNPGSETSSGGDTGPGVGSAPSSGNTAVAPGAVPGVVPGAGQTTSGGVAPATSGGATAGQINSTPSGGSAVVPGGPVQVGIVYESNLGAAFTSAGLQGASNASDDQIKSWLTQIGKYINAHGGYAGHPIQLVMHGVDPSKGSFDQASQSACSDLAEDHKVVAAVVGANVYSANLPTCLRQHGVPTVWNYQYLVDNATFRAFGPYLYQPAMISADRLGVVVDVLAKHDFFGSLAKVGLVRWDTPDAAYFTDKVLTPKLHAHGITNITEFAAAALQGESDAGRQEAQMSNAVLRFRSQGVTNVIFSPTDTVAPWLFMTNAESQQYRPKYGITSMDIPYFLEENAPPAQVANATGIGWNPEMDFPEPSKFPKNNPMQQLCLHINAAAGATNSASMLRYCDGLFFLQHAFTLAGAVLPTALADAVDRLGSSYRSAWSLTTDFAGGRHDGPSTVNYISYDARCPCFRYGQPYHLG